MNITSYNITDLASIGQHAIYSDRKHVVLSPLEVFPSNRSHFRMDCLVMVFCLNGKLHLNLSEHNIDIEMGHCLICPPNSVIHNVQKEGNCHITIVGFSLDVVTKILTGTREVWKMLATITSKPVVTNDVRYLNLRLQSFLSILRYRTQHNDLYREELCNHLFATLFFDVVNDIHIPQDQLSDNSERTYRSRTDQLYKEFLTLVNEDHGKNRTVKYYADKLCISSKYLSKITNDYAHNSAIRIIID